MPVRENIYGAVMTLTALASFLKGWGSLMVAAGSLSVAGWALVIGISNRRTLRKEHRWKEEDRRREDLAREHEDARTVWCRSMVAEATKGGPVLVPPDKLEWAAWGNGTFFTLRPKGPEGPYLIRLQG